MALLVARGDEERVLKQIIPHWFKMTAYNQLPSRDRLWKVFKYCIFNLPELRISQNETDLLSNSYCPYIKESIDKPGGISPFIRS